MSLGSESNFFLGAASAGAGGYEIERSVRFNSDDDAYLSRTFASGDLKLWTWSGWIKLTELDTLRAIFNAGLTSSATDRCMFRFNTNNTLGFVSSVGTYAQQSLDIQTDAIFRDTSAWYHVVLAFDVALTTGSADRLKIYVNGVNQPWTGTGPDVNKDQSINAPLEHRIGKLVYTDLYPTGFYLADIHFVDGQALAPTDFGKFDANGVWQPKAYSGAYGTNGFHLLDFANESVVGNDSSGNNNDWTANNITETITPTYANNRTTAYNGTVPNYSANPYWIDIIPTDGVLNYTGNTDNMALVHDGSTTTSIYWVGNLNDDGNIKRARFDLRSFGTISSVRIYAGFPSGYTNYKYRMLDSSKTEIPGTEGTFGGASWHDMVITGDPEYFEISCLHTTATTTRHRTYAVEVNGTVLVNGYASDMDVLYDASTNGTQEDTGAGGEVSGNYATWNPLANYLTISNGSLRVSQTVLAHHTSFATMGAYSGKWYWEVTKEDYLNSQETSLGLGVAKTSFTLDGSAYTSSTETNIAYMQGNVKFYDGVDGYTGFNTDLGPGEEHEPGIWMLAFDFDSGKGWIGKDGVWLSTINGTAGDPVAGTDPCFSAFDTDAIYVPMIGMYSNSSCSANFGQRPFAYTAPSGYKAFCTTSLDDPTIADGTDYFDAVAYSGDASSSAIDVTGFDFQPDLVWVKKRDGTTDTTTRSHVWTDVVRTAGVHLRSDNNDDEAALASNLVTAFNSNGFTAAYQVAVNYINSTFVAWAWKAGDTTDPANTDGTITSSVCANPSAGFSIVSYTGTGTAATVGHGLNAAPQMILVKNRDAAIDGRVYHVGTDAANPRLYWLKLFATTGDGGRQTTGAVWNDTAPTETVFSLGTASNVNYLDQKFIAYCWTPVEGYSAFGSYTGNGSDDGTFVYTGFKPTFVMYKRTDTTGNWHVDDSQRDGYNFANKNLYPNLVDDESTGSFIDILSNGFKLRTTSAPRNFLSGTYVYAAFAENPFKTARAR